MPQPWRALAQGEEDLLDFMDKAGPQVAGSQTALREDRSLYMTGSMW